MKIPPTPEHGLSRRGFLRGVAGGTAAVAVASLLPAGCAPTYPERRADGTRLRSLTPKEYAVARAAAEAMLVDVPVTPDAVASAIDAELAVAGDPMRTDMKTVLSLMEHGTLLSFRGRRFSALSPDARREVLEDWAASRLNLRRAAFQALKGFVVFFGYIDDATRQLTGFPGPWPERVQIAAYDVDFGEIG
ncbi:MAG TPA: twin-arginine translocation signal domain-containing protein [Longimicrobiales bacterium]